LEQVCWLENTEKGMRLAKELITALPPDAIKKIKYFSIKWNPPRSAWARPWEYSSA
jgi:hypothetical protein